MVKSIVKSLGGSTAVGCLLFVPFLHIGNVEAKARVLDFEVHTSRFLQTQATGVVKDDQGALPGVTVSVKENPLTKVTTDENGSFSIEAESGQTLVFQFLGYETVEKVFQGTPVEVHLISSMEALEDVVVTGYSTQKRENISSSISIIDSDKLKDVHAPNITNLLQGKAAGINVVSGSGRPGTSSNMRIRGRSSISSSTSPLWVVDGVVMHGEPNINPNDVESISVLKDAAATTQYGSRGTNGVIVVTTKSAGFGQTGEFSVNLTTGASKFNKGKFKLMNSAELWDVFQNFTNPSAIPDNVTEDVLNTDYDWVENGTQSAPHTDLNLTYSGASETTKIMVAGNYYNEEGTVKGYEYDRATARINLEHKLTDNLTFKPKLYGSYLSYDSRQHSIYDMYLNMPWDAPYRDGVIVNPVDANNRVLWYGRDARNYLYDLQYNYGQGQTLDLHANFDFSYRISDRFTFESMNNLTYYNQTTMGYTDPNSNAGLSNKGSVSQFASKRITRFFNQMLKYNEQFDKHNLSAFVAYEYSDYMYTDVGAAGKGITPGSVIINNAADFLSHSGTKNDYAFQSGLLQASYGYDDRYNVQASFRVDGASRFGKNKQYGSFYSISGAWNIHRESFFDVSAINELRLRASYGSVGNVPNSLYASYATYSLDGQYNGNAAAIPSQYQNLDVSWETSKDANLGLEARLWNRVNLNVDLYHKNTDGLLYYVTFPATAGWSGYWDNIGAIKNQGVEWSVDADIFAPEKDFQWNVSLNFAHNKNEIKELKDGADIPSGNKRFSEGRDIDSWYMRKWAGVNPENGNPQWEMVDSETGEITHTSNYNDASLQFVGTSTPKYQGGIFSTMNYKRVSLTASFAYLKGALAYHSAREYFDADGAYPYYNQMALQDGWSRWSADNPNATHPKMDYNNNSGSNKTSTRYLEDVSFFRLRNLTLGYQFDPSLTERIRVKNLGVFLSVDNLWNATKFSGLDPEVALSAANPSPGGSEAGDATSQYPSPKRVLFGLQFSF